MTTDTGVQAAQDELTAMLDDGLAAELVEETPGRFRLTIIADETACAECIVPDNVLEMITLDKLQSRDVSAAAVTIVRA